jgi:hypothetical protein
MMAGWRNVQTGSSRGAGGEMAQCCGTAHADDPILRSSRIDLTKYSRRWQCALSAGWGLEVAPDELSGRIP